MNEQTKQPVWLIVGAAGGLGSALANQAARQPQPPELVLLDKNHRALEKLADKLEAETKAVVSVYPLDLSGAAPTDYEAMVSAIVTAHERLDAIVFCQAQTGGLRPMLQTHGRDWLLELHANLGGPQLLLQSCLDLLLQSPDGRVVFCVNEAATVNQAYWGAYGVAQSGLPALANQWSQELANTSVRFLLCYPGAMRTSLRMEIWPAISPDTWPEPTVCASAINDWLAQANILAELQTLKLAPTKH